MGGGGGGGGVGWVGVVVLYVCKHMYRFFCFLLKDGFLG